MREYTYFTYGILFVILLLVEMIYFKLANKFEIIDKPNLRSSHTQPTIRGGGIIFFIASLMWFFNSDFAYSWFFLGLSLVAIISFIDDVKPQHAIVRFIVHLAAISLLFYQIQLTWVWWLMLIAAIVCIGSLNAFNFMDGINGITGIYAGINLATFLYIQKYLIDFSGISFMTFIMLAVVIFLHFNFRKTAKCFAGDIGSISLAYIQVFLLLLLINKTNNFYWVVMFLVFGIDSTVTIINRLIRKENIFTPHRTHLYQYLANEFSWPHKRVAILYGLVQLVINILLLSFYQDQSIIIIITSTSILFLYIFIRRQMIHGIKEIHE